ncbi:MAG: BrxA/BrxB family bacilliredoxin [Melioribacteraceae bacterium]|jgi:putative YphP/YqiW family bacilliredoxin|nr:BrxA/BrxB family bacilliredoxin [Melioribacteraceae bacterium]
MFSINHKAPIYDPVAVQPMRDELTFVGFQETITPQQIDESLGQKNDETVLVVINSVCGCSAGSARPGVTDALQNDIIPNRLITVFAGQDREAVDHLRENYLKNIPPSSPFIALFKNGEPIHILPRHRIEGRYAEEIADELKKVFNENCTNQGPSISTEKYKELIHAKACGSKIPLNN